MKTTFVIVGLVVGLLHTPSVGGQTYTGDVWLASQAEVDAFNYTEITGHLDIYQGNDITSLSALASLARVGKSLYIANNPALITVVDGFNSLTNVGWGVFVNNHSNLVSFAGFAALQETGDNIEFYNNQSLGSISGFNSLHTAGWSLEIGRNPALTNLPAFESLHTITSSLFIYDNASLPRIKGFNALQYVDWSFYIVGNTSLRNLCGFYNYLSITNHYTGGGAFNINNNHPDLPNPTTFQDVLNAGPCPDRCAITAISLANADQCVVNWQAFRDGTYTLQYCEDLSAIPQVWTNVTGFIDLPGPLFAPWSLSGTNTGVTSIPRRFCRVRFTFP